MRRLQVLLVILVALAAPALTMAQQIGSPLIISVDVTKIIQDSSASIELRKQINAQQQTFQQAVIQEQEAFRVKEQELLKAKDSISQEDFNSRRRELEQQVGAIRQNIQQRKQYLDQVMGTGVRQIEAELMKVVAELAKERGANMVVSQSAVVIMAPDFDVTADAMKRLNERLPKLPTE
jgi:Skp family chaperone for outer membrane proteins